MPEKLSEVQKRNSVMKSRTKLVALIFPIVAGCATPVAVMKNDATGQVARCGGDSSGFMAGGLIGYNVQRNNDDSCVADYEKQGFKRIQ
jgi:hypothetical protein